MTTMAQLDKFAAKWFNDQMRRRGFAVEKKFIFWRKRGPLYDMFISDILSGGTNLRISISIWSPWVDNPENGELGVFPPSYTLVGGTLSEDFPKYLRGGEVFSVASEEDSEKSFKNILNMIDMYALPWFPQIDSFESYIAYVNTRAFLGDQGLKDRIRKGIARGFECEPYL